jgi:hypothetical protein
MEAGDTFRFVEHEDHLWIVLSDPHQDADHVLLVNVTSWRRDKDQACLLSAGEHPFVVHNSCVNYEDAQVCAYVHLLDLLNRGRIVVQDALRPEILKHIRDCAADSTRMAVGKWQLLVDQGLVDEDAP